MTETQFLSLPVTEKEATGSLSDEILRDFTTDFHIYVTLKIKEEILRLIDEQEKF